MTARILVPVDGCEQSEAILPYAEEISNRLGASVTLLHVLPPSLHEQIALHEQYIASLADRMRQHLRGSTVEVAGVVLEGKPNREIADYAARADIGLIAAAPHSQSSGGHWTIGRTADKVIRESSKPVLLAAGTTALPGSDGMLSRILVPLDGSQASREVLPHVESLLRSRWHEGHSILYLTHVIPGDHYASGPLIARRVPYTNAELDDLNGQASRYLQEVVTLLRAPERRIEIRVTVGDPATRILETAFAVGANLIAMTTHGYSGFSRMFLGSVADRVLHTTTIPLLLVKPLVY
ncbi:MAG: universal stress protein [Dehalococcoidia bacterium]|jgi:nucleotide-binding universal stress UspA family protein|nr:universal stress protein [Dehalococcoidia bacterium]